MATEIGTVSTFDIVVHGNSHFSNAFKNCLEEFEDWKLMEEGDTFQLVKETDCYVYTYFMIPCNKEEVDSVFACVVEINGKFHTPIPSYIYQDESGIKQLNII